MSEPRPCTDPQLIRHGRELDAALWPLVDRVCARLGITRAELLAMPHPAPDMVATETETDSAA